MAFNFTYLVTDNVNCIPGHAQRPQMPVFQRFVEFPPIDTCESVEYFVIGGYGIYEFRAVENNWQAFNCIP